MRKVAGNETLGCYWLTDTVNEEYVYTYYKLVKCKLTKYVS